jgi:long-chain acyl-CoA synthetase
LSDDEPVGFWSVAAADPRRVAIVAGDGEQTTFGELHAASRAVGRGLRGLGLRRGDAVAMVLPNVPATFTIYLAAMESGLYLTPVNSHLAAPEVAHVIADCEAGAVVVHHDLAETCRPGVEQAGVRPDCRFAEPDASGFRPFAELAESAGDRTDPPEGTGTGTLMLYTSGTTGKPKGVRRPLPVDDADATLGAASRVYCPGFGMPIGPRAHLVCGPLYHAGPSASAFAALHAGNTIVLMDSWTPHGFLELVERHRVASTQMVPTMFHRLLALPEEERARYDISSITGVMHTGAPCPVHVKHAFMDWFGPVVYETYGGTESVATIATPRRWLKNPGTVGKPIHGVTVHILDEQGNEMPAGEAGEIWVESAQARNTEYFNDTDKTARMRRGDMVTLGDVGYLDEEGLLFLRDRVVDMIISGGVNIYPAEIESVLLACPLVGDAAVIGIPDDEWGEQVLAIVEPAAGVAADDETAAELRSFCEERLARFKLPRRIEFVDTLPRLPNGKIQKRTLRAPYWEGSDRAI